MTRLTTILLILTFLIPAPILAQVGTSTPVEPSPEAITIPIYPYLEHSTTTAYGVFVASPWDVTAEVGLILQNSRED